MPKAAPVGPTDDEAARLVERRLAGIAARFEPGLRDRVGRLVSAVAEAIQQLPELDLVRHEGSEETASHSLAVWEEVAPVVAETVASVNRAIETAHATFPAAPEDEPLAGLDEAFSPGGGGAAPAEPLSTEEEIAQLCSAVTSGLRRDVTRLGERLRNPTVVADPWNLVSDLLEFRGRLRAGLGELVYQLASFVEEVERAFVVPGYAADLEQALLLRQAATNLAFLFRGHARRIAAAADDRIVAALREGLKDLHAFSRTRALPSLRTADKRVFLETQVHLQALAREQPPRPREIKQAVENLARWLDSLSVISRREILRLHDRTQLAAVGRALEAAQSSLHAPTRARAELAEAVRRAGGLYGRDAQLDTYLRARRHFDVSWLLDAELESEIELLGKLIAGVPAP